MGKAAVRLGTCEDQREWRCHSEYRGRIRQSQGAGAVGGYSYMEMGNMWKSKLGSCQRIWSLNASLSAKFNGGEDYWALRNWCVHALCTYRLFLAVVLVRSDVELQRSGSELVEGRSQLKAVLEQRHPCKDVQTQSGSWHGYHQTPHIPVEW